MTKAKIYYFSLTDEMLKNDKLLWFHNTKFQNIPFENIKPSKKNNWINLADTDFEELLPLADKKSKKVLFELYSNGVSTNRDEWVYDFDINNLIDKMSYFAKVYNQSIAKQEINEKIKWSSSLSAGFKRKEKAKFDNSLIIKSNYRPYIKIFFYADKLFNDRLTQNHYDFFGKNLLLNNFVICQNSNGKDIRIIITKNVSDLHFTGDTKMFSLYRYDSNGNRHDNLTDWGLSQFTTHYKDESITKEAIFHYTYAVLHHPAYRKKYELNLKREFPRLPFYKDFWQWSNKGKELMDLHLNYETVEPFALKRVDKAEPKKGADTLFADEKGSDAFKASHPSKNQRKLKVKLKADKEKGIIYIDEDTHLEGVPDIAWTYQLGNRSALEWILDQYKEKKPKDKTIAEKFDTYRFADYKETVIDLLMRVCTVSVRTVEIIEDF